MTSTLDVVSRAPFNDTFANIVLDDLDPPEELEEDDMLPVVTMCSFAALYRPSMRASGAASQPAERPRMDSNVSATSLFVAAREGFARRQAAQEWHEMCQDFKQGVQQSFIGVCGLTALIWAYTFAFLGHNVLELDMCGYLAAVWLGLPIFGLGLRRGLMPLGELVGSGLPHTASRTTVFLVAFVLGVLCTVAEPAISSLDHMGRDTDAEKAPLLSKLLGMPTILMVTVGVGVGFAAVLGCLRLLVGMGIKCALFCTCLPALLVTIAVQGQNEKLSQVTGLAWDCGAVTTGPVTMPIILALGMGLSRSIAEAADAEDERRRALSPSPSVRLAPPTPVPGPGVEARSHASTGVGIEHFQTGRSWAASTGDEDQTGRSWAVSANDENGSSVDFNRVRLGTDDSAPGSVPGSFAERPATGTSFTPSALAGGNRTRLGTDDSASGRRVRAGTGDSVSGSFASGNRVRFGSDDSTSRGRVRVGTGDSVEMPGHAVGGRVRLGTGNSAASSQASGHRVRFDTSASESSDIRRPSSPLRVRIASDDSDFLPSNVLRMDSLDMAMRNSGESGVGAQVSSPNAWYRSGSFNTNLDVDPDLSGFGVMTFASLSPVVSVWALALLDVDLRALQRVFQVHLPVLGAPSAAADPGEDHRALRYIAIVAAKATLRAVLPLAGFLLFMRAVVQGARVPAKKLFIGIMQCLVGMFLFTMGLAGALVPLGDHVGAALPSAADQDGLLLGTIVVSAFGFLVGFGAVFAEPALLALGETVEKLTQSRLKKTRFIRTVSLGAGAGIALGFLKVYHNLDLWLFLLSGYSLCLLLTVFSDEVVTCIAWDSAGATTGPVAVPIVLASGLALGDTANTDQGFGILACASMGPILAVLILGMISKNVPRAPLRQRRRSLTPQEMSMRVGQSIVIQ